MVERMIDPTEGPSIAALVTPWTPDTTLVHLDAALKKDGYRARTPGALPPGYRAHAGELVQLKLVTLAKTGLTGVLVVEIARVFHVLRLLSAAAPTEVLVGWRRFSGFEPVAKVYWGGKGQWKDGEDPDHESEYHLPRQPPAELRYPTPPRVPLTANELTALLLPVVRPLSVAEASAAWVLKDSALA